jgi:hypothetical protein
LAAVVVLAAAAAYETAVALELLSVGPLPGEGPAGEWFVEVAAFAASLVGIGTSVASIRRPHAQRSTPSLLLAPAAAAYVIARLYAFDPYYAPTLRRASEDGIIPEWWVFLLAGASLVAAILVRTRPRQGSILTCVVLVACTFTAAVEHAGH